MSGPPQGFQDLANLSEDERIKVIAHYVVAHGLTVAVCVDDEPGKPERYAKKLRAFGAVEGIASDYKAAATSDAGKKAELKKLEDEMRGRAQQLRAQLRAAGLP